MTLLDGRPDVSSPPAGSGAPVLGRLLGPERLTDFADRVWGREALLVRDAAPELASLLTLDDVDELLARRGVRTPFVRVARNGDVLPSTSFTSGGGLGAGIADQVDTAKLAGLLDGGATVVLQGLHRIWAPVASFAAQLVSELGHPVQVNAYLTPPAAQGFAPHYDTHDVFVVQTSGTKHWSICAPAVTPAQRGDDWTRHRQAVADASSGTPAYDVDLAPGTVLYLPRGWIHSARANDGMSLHLTIGIHSYTRRQVLDAVLAEASRLVVEKHADHLASPLPLGVDVADPGQLAALVREAADLLDVGLGRVSPDAVASRLESRRSTDSRPLQVPPVRQALAMSSLPPAVVLAPGARVRLVSDGGLVSVLADGALVARTSPSFVEPLQRLLDGDVVDSSWLQGGAGDDALLHCLLRACAVVPASAG
jgi:hypothetical protein